MTGPALLPRIGHRAALHALTVLLAALVLVAAAALAAFTTTQAAPPAHGPRVVSPQPAPPWGLITIRSIR